MLKLVHRQFGLALRLGAVAAGFLLAANMRADVFTYDTTLTSPDTNAAPGPVDANSGARVSRKAARWAAVKRDQYRRISAGDRSNMSEGR